MSSIFFALLLALSATGPASAHDAAPLSPPQAPSPAVDDPEAPPTAPAHREKVARDDEQPVVPAEQDAPETTDEPELSPLVIVGGPK